MCCHVSQLSNQRSVCVSLSNSHDTCAVHWASSLGGKKRGKSTETKVFFRVVFNRNVVAPAKENNLLEQTQALHRLEEISVSLTPKDNSLSSMEHSSSASAGKDINSSSLWICLPGDATTLSRPWKPSISVAGCDSTEMGICVWIWMNNLCPCCSSFQMPTANVVL